MRSSRLFEIIQLLRSATKPLRAADIAETLEVTPRTIYRDVASLQAMRVPIEGAAGVGYVMRAGYDLPAINFDLDEAEAVNLGLSMITRTGDKSLLKAAQSAARKLAAAAKPTDTLFSSTWGIPTPDNIDLADLRLAIRSATKLDLTYRDVDGKPTRRRVLPIALVYYAESAVLAAWCELRRDFRHFRPDRMDFCTATGLSFAHQATELRTQWAALNSEGF